MLNYFKKMTMVYPKFLPNMCMENWLALYHSNKFFMLELLVISITVLMVLFFSVVVVNQGTIAIITMFGKYQRIMLPGLRFKIPLVESIFRRVSIQNQSIELEFQAVTIDQANVYFKSMLLYSVQNAEEETIKKVAFKFISNKDLMQALVRTVEGSIRAYVATKRQAEVLTARREIVDFVKEQIDNSLEEWGYHLQDLQINDITFDQVVMESMSKVVASNNLKAAAENEGQALLITKTKAAEAEGNSIKISAQAEKEAAQLRGQGVALFRQEVAKGMTEAAEEMKQANLDTNVILFSMWTEAIKNFAEYGKGNVIFLDGSPEGMDKTMKQMMGLITKKENMQDTRN
jgi:regulator of protease activity HflC (stomatin/prohibitin superfamily)